MVATGEGGGMGDGVAKDGVWIESTGEDRREEEEVEEKEVAVAGRVSMYGQSVTRKREGEESSGEMEESAEVAVVGVRTMQSRASVAKVGQAEMRCQHCTGSLMYECGEIKRVTRQTGGGWKGEPSTLKESSCTSASRC
ncbi:hypothetical protein Q5P01_021097 [Channa striata]|uniref:Uncharacterized protein n=1 Tax=Channa striata TaxID=64152 RepID=A0AA88LTM0_CHASR|nr:hypothetical protein Q5P01_021097 [Channa striata]